MPTFSDHFSAVAADYAAARPEYPPALFDWIASIAPARGLCWEAGCGSGQATRDLARRFDHVHASDPSAAQIAQAPKLANVDFAVETGERCGLPDATADVVCVAQALHWFDRAAFFAEVERVLRPGGVLVVWGYQDLVAPTGLEAANRAFRDAIHPYWPPERIDVDAGYAGYPWPFPAIDVPQFEMVADWPLQRLLGYFSSSSASKRYREATGRDAVVESTPALEQAWGDAATQRVRWPLFVRAFRKPVLEEAR
ncbi:class I SAM-dependent methyltransferase [Solilutibacter silvestris]|uniref:Methyltransferase n=1 Tax=Solilutibacter silvestris TaxID=1645665 RepID=A0A2K1Q2K2_9GAMM|nr:class I SAM-dependent methyltransferase [Lysobacter silvestris]PNS09264.1 Methyltransferase [Lysobacter silvestris]